jgi:hypothetical protein
MRCLIPGFVAAAALTAATMASAQPAPPPAAIEEPSRGWSALAGYEVFSLRDISRNIRPPDASPVAWRGSGQAITGRYESSRLRSAHLIDGSVARVRDFSYVSPARSFDAMRADFAARMDARYEYRRYFWRDVGADGLDIGVGGQGIATHVGFDRHITAALATRTRITGGGLAGVISVRVRRWSRLHLDASWANGAIVSRRTAEHSANAAAETFGGGNFLTDSAVRAEWRLTRATRLSLVWQRSYEGYQSTHYSYAANRQSINVGVRYAR